MEISRHWRLKQQRYALVGEVCPHCDTKIFPPKDVCPNCHGEATIPVKPKRGGNVLYKATESSSNLQRDGVNYQAVAS